MEIAMTNGFSELSFNEMENVCDGKGLIGAVAFGVLGFGIGLATAPFKAMAFNAAYEAVTGKEKEITFGQIMRSAAISGGRAAAAGAVCTFVF